MSISTSLFDQTPLLGSELIYDGEEKLRLAFLGLGDDKIREKFSIVGEAVSAKESIFGSHKYMCAHVRRGDYTNVASFLVEDRLFVDTIKTMTRLVKHLLVVTDTEPNTQFNNELQSLEIETKFLIGGDVAVVHGLMRMSDILICSNSQFSYTAAALRSTNLLTLLPSKHDAEPNSPTNSFLKSVGFFMAATEFKPAF